MSFDSQFPVTRLYDQLAVSGPGGAYEVLILLGDTPNICRREQFLSYAVHEIQYLDATGFASARYRLSLKVPPLRFLAVEGSLSCAGVSGRDTK